MMLCVITMVTIWAVFKQCCVLPLYTCTGWKSENHRYTRCHHNKEAIFFLYSRCHMGQWGIVVMSLCACVCASVCYIWGQNSFWTNGAATMKLVQGHHLIGRLCEFKILWPWLLLLFVADPATKKFMAN